MYNKLRLADRALPREEALDILRQNEYGVLATVNPAGEPRTVAMNFYLRPDNQTIIFHGAKAGEKIENIKQNSQVSFFVVGQEKTFPNKYDSAYRSVSVQGRAEIVTGDALFPYLLEMTQGLGATTTEQHIHDFTYPAWIGKLAVILLHIEDLKGKHHIIEE